MSAASWLDVMPAIPLARAVPVVLLGKAPHRGVTTRTPTEEGAYVTFTYNGDRGEYIEGAMLDMHYRVDLDDSQGFAYALRYVMRHAGGKAMPPGAMAALRLRHLMDESTDADRLALATALREVTP